MTTSIIKNSKPSIAARYNLHRKNIFHPKSDTLINSLELQNLKDSFSKIDYALIYQLFDNRLREHVLSIQKIEIKSTFHILYTVKTENNTYVLKINVLSNYYPDCGFYLELFAQSLLKKLELPSISVLDVDLSKSEFPFEFMIMGYIKGTNLENNNKKNQKSIYLKLGQLFKKIHSVKTYGAGNIDMDALLEGKELRGTMNRWEDFFQLNLDNHINNVHKLKILTNKQKEKIKKIFEENKELLKINKLSLLHNDPGTRNVITDGKNIAAIIDWEDAVIGDPLWEIAFVNTFLFRTEDREKFISFCKGYEINNKELEKNPLFWLYYLRISLIKTISRSNDINYNKKGRDIDKMRILNSLKFFN